MAAAGERYLAANGCHLLGQMQRAQGRLGAAAGTYRLALLCWSLVSQRVITSPSRAGSKETLFLVVEHVGGHVGNDDAPGGEPVPVGVEVGKTEVIRDVLVPVVGLGNERAKQRGARRANRQLNVLLYAAAPTYVRSSSPGFPVPSRRPIHRPPLVASSVVRWAVGCAKLRMVLSLSRSVRNDQLAVWVEGAGSLCMGHAIGRRVGGDRRDRGRRSAAACHGHQARTGTVFPCRDSGPLTRRGTWRSRLRPVRQRGTTAAADQRPLGR